MAPREKGLFITPDRSGGQTLPDPRPDRPAFLLGLWRREGYNTFNVWRVAGRSRAATVFDAPPSRLTIAVRGGNRPTG